MDMNKGLVPKLIFVLCACVSITNNNNNNNITTLLNARVLKWTKSQILYETQIIVKIKGVLSLDLNYASTFSNICTCECQYTYCISTSSANLIYATIIP